MRLLTVLLFLLALDRFHFDRDLRRGAAAIDDLLLGALAELVRGHLELLGQLAVAEDLDLAGAAKDQAGLRELLDADLRPVLEPLQLATR